MQASPPPVLFGERTIRARVGELARQISADYADKGEVLLVGVLRGCFIFLADLARQLTVPNRIEFTALSTYEGPATEPGPVDFLLDLRTDIRGRHVLVVDDILDTGSTLHRLLAELTGRGPASLRVCALLRKAERLTTPVTADYVGFDIPDRWVVGYGLDYRGRFRSLPYVGVVEPDA